MSFNERNNYSIGMSIESSFLQQTGVRTPIRVNGEYTKIKGMPSGEDIHRRIFSKPTLILENYSEGEGKEKVWKRKSHTALIPEQGDRKELFAVDYYATTETASGKPKLCYGNIKAMTVSCTDKQFMRWDATKGKRVPDGMGLSLVGKKVEITSGIGVSAVRWLLANHDYFVMLLIPYDKYSDSRNQAFICAEFNYSEYYRRCVKQGHWMDKETDKYLAEYGLTPKTYGHFKRVKLEQYDWNNRGSDGTKMGQISLHCKPFNRGFQQIYPISEWTRPPEIWMASFNHKLKTHQAQVDSYVWEKSKLTFPIESYRF